MHKLPSAKSRLCRRVCASQPRADGRGKAGATPGIPGAYPPRLGMPTCLPWSCGSSLLLSAPHLAATAIPESGKFLNAKITPKGFMKEREKKNNQPTLSSPLLRPSCCQLKENVFSLCLDSLTDLFSPPFPPPPWMKVAGISTKYIWRSQGFNTSSF